MGFQPPLVRSLIINNINGQGIKKTEQRLVCPESKQSGATRLHADCKQFLIHLIMADRGFHAIKNYDIGMYFVFNIMTRTSYI
jgi:hypothetical protein